MDASVITALSGLAGATIGGLASGLASWFSQRSQANAQWLLQNQLRRQDVYKVFIEQASKLYIEALQSDQPDISALMGLYAQVSRMRVLSSSEIVEKADAALRTIVDIYFSPNKTMAELRAEINGGKLDLLREFSTAARQELSALKY